MTTDDLLKQGIAALKSGRRAEARELLMQVIQQDKCNEMAWLWMSGAVGTDYDRQVCLQKVLAINPNNVAAQRGIEMLREQSSARVDSTQDTDLLKDKPATLSVVKTEKDVQTPKQLSPASSPPPTKKCPYCAELIQLDAIVCRFCGRDLAITNSSQRQSRSPEINVPKCPTCGSTNIERISATSKVGTAILFGIFAAGAISKTFKCNNCGHQW